jgi:hypothetical protein
METKLKTVSEFAKSRDIAAFVEWADGNPNINDMGPGARHFLVKLRRTVGGRKLVMPVPFSQGGAYTEEPTAADVLDCLAMDAASYDNARNFAEWAADMGYDEDSRTAARLYRAVKESREKLFAFLGPASYEELLYKTERL